MGSDEQLQLIGFIEIWTSHQLFEEHVEIETSLLDKFLAMVTNLPFPGYRWYVQTRVSLIQHLSKKEEFIVSPLNLISSMLIFTID